MSHRQQQQSAVQHAVRQALSPVSSLRRSSTTYTAGTGELGQSKSSTEHLQHPTTSLHHPGIAAVPLCTAALTSGGPGSLETSWCTGEHLWEQRCQAAMVLGATAPQATISAPSEDPLSPPMTAAPLGQEGSLGEALLSAARPRLLGLHSIMTLT